MTRIDLELILVSLVIAKGKVYETVKDHVIGVIFPLDKITIFQLIKTWNSAPVDRKIKTFLRKV